MKSVGSACGSVGKAVASATRGRGFFKKSCKVQNDSFEIRKTESVGTDTPPKTKSLMDPANHSITAVIPFKKSLTCLTFHSTCCRMRGSGFRCTGDVTARRPGNRKLVGCGFRNTDTFFRSRKTVKFARFCEC